MDINELTIGQAKELANMLGGSQKITEKRHGFEVGKSYFIRTVTHHYLGKCIGVYELCIVMKKCTWVADDGRFHKAMQGDWTNNAEHEIYPPETPVQILINSTSNLL